MRVAWLAGLVVVGLVASPARGDEWSHRYPLKGTADLHFKTDDGGVRIETSDSADISARVTTEGWRIAPDEVVITESQAGDRVDIEVRVPKHHGLSAGHRSVRVVLQVPKHADLDVRTGDGAVEVQPVSGHLSIATGDGSITVDGLQGENQLHTGDGAIRATGLDGQLKADTGDGHITIDKPLAVTGTISSSTVRGKLGAGGQPLRIHTGDGSIHLRRL